MSFAAQELRSLGGYEVTRRLGSGGMAEVFLAKQRMAGGVERTVVVKSILPHLAGDESFVKMFLREARIAAMLTHPNIVHIHDVAIIEGRACIVMEFLRGRDLSFVLKRVRQAGARPPATAAVAVAAQAATGLDYAHTKKDERGRAMQVVHRDISPHNLFVARDGHVRVLDFGIARSAHEQQLTDTGSLKGKLAYLAPEYVKERAVTAQLDQFAVGIVLWESLTGQRLFHRSDPLSTMQAVLEHQPAPPSRLAPELPRELDEIVLQALDRDPRARFPDCGALATALRTWLRTADTRPETEIIAEWLHEVVPPGEDTALYLPAPPRSPPPGPETTDVEPGVPGEARTASGVQGRTRSVEARAGSDAAGAGDGTLSLAGSVDIAAPAPERRTPRAPSLALFLAMGAALLLAAALAVIVVMSVPLPGDAPSSATAPLIAPPPTSLPPIPPAPPPPIAQVEAPPPTSTPVVPSPIEVRFTGAQGVRITVDGVRLEGNVWRGLPSSERHSVRFLRRRDHAEREIEAVFDAARTIPVPAFPRGLPPRILDHGLQH